MQPTADVCFSTTPPSRLMGGENSSFAHNSLHLKITSGFAIRVVGDTVHTQYRCPSPGSGLYFLCVWCRGGGMQERELLSTQPHLPTSAMTLRHTAATSPQNTNHQWGWVQISVGVTEVKDKAAAEVKQAPAVGTPERHYRPLERARQKRRLRSSVRCVFLQPRVHRLRMVTGGMGG